MAAIFWLMWLVIAVSNMPPPMASRNQNGSGAVILVAVSIA
jgi:hypothetical protein